MRSPPSTSCAPPSLILTLYHTHARSNLLQALDGRYVEEDTL